MGQGRESGGTGGELRSQIVSEGRHDIRSRAAQIVQMLRRKLLERECGLDPKDVDNALDQRAEIERWWPIIKAVGIKAE